MESTKRSSSPEPSEGSSDKRLKQDESEVGGGDSAATPASLQSSTEKSSPVGTIDNVSQSEDKIKPPGTEDEPAEGGLQLNGYEPERWQISCKSIKDRMAKIFKSQNLSDCTFIIGEKDVKVYKLHSVILSMSSPVFEDLLSDNKNQEVKMSDIEPNVFDLILEYIYLDILDLDTIEKAHVLYRASQKLRLTLLIEKAVQLMMSNMNFDSIWPTLESAQITCDVILRAECFKYLKKNAKDLLKHPKFLNLHKSVVEDIVCEEVLEGVLEAELVAGVLLWAKAQCANAEVPDTFENKRELLGEKIITKLRFLAFPQMTFVKEVACTTKRSEDSILTREESYAVLLNLIVPGIEPLPEILCKDTRVRVAGKLRVVRKVFNPMGVYPNYPPQFGVGQYDRMVVLANPSPISSFGAKNFSCDVVVNHPITLMGVQVPTFFSPQKNVSMEYDESYVVTVQTSYNNRNITTTTWKGKVKYNSVLDIMLNNSVVMERNIKYSILIYTSNMYYISRKLTNLENRPPVQFTFKDTVQYFGAPSTAKLGTDFGFVTDLVYSLN